MSITKEQVIEQLKNVYDPEIPVNVVDLGMIYDVRIGEKDIKIDMALTAPGCPLAMMIAGAVENSVKQIAESYNVKVNIVTDPPWTPDRLSEKAREILGIKSE